MTKLYTLALSLLCACLFSVNTYSQNTCANATQIGAVPYASPNHSPLNQNGLTTCNKGDEYNLNLGCPPAGLNREDFVFRFVPRMGEECATITLNGPTGSLSPNLSVGAAVAVYKGCPGGTGSLCLGKVISATGQNTITLPGITYDAGEEYFIVVDGGTACFGFILRVDKATCPTVPPPTGGPGTNCSNFEEITFPYNNVPGSTGGMGVDFLPGTGCIGTGNLGEDKVYHFSLTAQTCIRFNLSNMSANGSLYLNQGCPGTAGSVCLRAKPCNKPACYNNIVEEMTLGPGDYYITVKGNTPVPLTYNLTVDKGNVDDNVICQTCNDEENCISCKNSGFEKMSLQGWTGYLGYWADPEVEVRFATGALNNRDSRHTITSKGVMDSIITTLPATSPWGGDYSLRLGNDRIEENATNPYPTNCDAGLPGDPNNNPNGDAEAISYQFVIDQSNTNFIYDYAVAFQSPNGHTDQEQPFFSILLEIDGVKIDCGSYEVSALTPTGFIQGPSVEPRRGSGGGGGGGTPVFYKPWTQVNIPLIDYIGKTAKITFTTKDCKKDGHFGYAYLDARCERLEILRDSNLLCSPDSVDLAAPAGFKSYRWSTGDTTRAVKVFGKGIYTVECTTVTDCKITLETEIKYEEAPKPDFEWKFDCKDSVVTFTDKSKPVGSNSITEWRWSFGDGDSAFIQNPKHKYFTSGQFNVTLTLNSKAGCIGDTAITIPIDVFMPQGDPNAIDSINLCEKSTMYLHADLIDSTKYEWKGPGGFSSSLPDPEKLNVAPKDTGWYKIKITIKNCVIKEDSTHLYVEPLKKPFITPDTIICQGDTAKLYGGGGKTHQWVPNFNLSSDTARVIKAWPDTTTVYTLLMFNDLCPDTSLSVQVRVLSGVVSILMPDTIKVCPGDSVHMIANTNGFDVFKWTGPNNYTSNKPQPSFPKMSAIKEGYYIIDCSISTNDCLVGRDSTYVGMHPVPVINISPDPAAICFGDSIQLTASGANTYRWTPKANVSDTTASTTWFKPAITTEYFAKGTNLEGCSASDSLTILVKPNPKPNLGPDQLLCLGDSTFVTTTIKYDSLQWSTGATSDTIFMKATDQFNVVAYQSGCFGKDTVNVTFQDPGTFTLGPDTLLCIGNGYYTNISVGNADSSRWNDNVTTMNRTIFTAGTYYVDIYAGKCMYTDTIVVLFDSIPVFSLGPDQTVCIGTSVTFNATQVQSIAYLWSNNATTPTITVNTTGDYWAQVTSVRCMYRDTVRLTVVNPPKLDLGPDRNICQGDSVTFTSNVNGGLTSSYLWSTNATTPSIRAKVQNNYSLIVSYGPCTLYDTVRLNVQQPTPFTLAPDTTLCENQSYTITGPTGFDTYTWNTTPVANTKDYIPTQSGLYILVARVALCTSRDSIRVTFDTIPHFQLQKDTVICQGDSFRFTSPIIASNYLWNNVFTTRSIWAKTQGDYRLFIQNGKCSWRDTVHLNVQDPPPLNIGPDSIVCIGTGVRFGDSISVATAKYTWNTGDTTAFITKFDPQTYTLTVDDGVCQNSDQANLNINLMPQPDLGPDTLLCSNQVLNLFANTFGDTYKWNTPSKLNTTGVTKTGTYWVEVHNGYCVNTDTIRVTFQPEHLVLLPPDQLICSGDRFDIDPITNSLNPVFRWNTGKNARTITVRDSGTYVLRVTDGACVATDTIVVSIAPNPGLDEMYFMICPEDSAIFHLPKGYVYQHQSDFSVFTDTVIYPRQEFNLFIYDTNNCRFTTAIKAEMDLECNREIYVPNTFTPNNDGVNDIFRVVPDNVKLIEMLIFDRWGHLLYSTNDPEQKGWDGRFKGEVCKQDVYEYKVTWEDAYAKPKVTLGHVNLLK